MRYREIAPPHGLADAVACLWTLEGPADPALHPDPVLPDGCPELIVQAGDPYDQLGPDGLVRQPRALLAGPASRSLWLRAPAAARTLGVRFRPGRAGRVLALPLDAVADRVVDLAALWGAAGDALAARWTETPLDELPSLVARELLLRRGRNGRSRGPHPGAEWAVAAAFHAPGRSVSDLARASGWSRRQLEREVRAAAGLPLRTLRRIARLQRVLAASHDGKESWAGIARDCGYADQAHLVRDFRELAGRPPQAHRDGAGELSRTFAGPERLVRLLEVPP